MSGHFLECCAFGLPLVAFFCGGHLLQCARIQIDGVLSPLRNRHSYEGLPKRRRSDPVMRYGVERMFIRSEVAGFVGAYF